MKLTVPEAGQGSASAAPQRTSTPGIRSRAAVTNDSDGSIALTESVPSFATRIAVSAPGPHPTSSTRCPGRQAQPGGELPGERSGKPAHELVVGVSRNGEGHGT